MDTQAENSGPFSDSVYLAALGDIQKFITGAISKLKAGARHSAKDGDEIQAIHDHAKSLGAECMATMSVIKQKDGRSRWVMFSSTSYQDRDGEIVSQKAVADDVARLDALGDYGPLDWWHIDGLNLGQCDYNAMDGRVLIESGTFVNEAVGEAVKNAADSLGGSIAFYHPESEPRDGVYTNIRRFARALLPKDKASNLFTSLTVKEPDMEITKEKFDKLIELLGADEAQAQISKSEAVQKAADLARIKFKEEGVEVEVDAPAVKPATGMTEAELVAFIQKVVASMSAGKESEAAMTEAQAKATKDLQAELVKVKNLQTISAKRVTELETQLKELTSEQPRAATKGYRATEDPATVRAEKQSTPTGPKADPDFMKFLTGIGAQ